MTFDFTADWLDHSTTTDSEPHLPRRSGAVLKPKAPPHPSNTQLAALVQELFTEGTLSWDQLQAISKVSDLRPMLEPTLAGISPIRRASTAR